MLSLALQLLIPLRYYFTDDPFDERFAWRMFSGVRVTHCESGATTITTKGASEAVELHKVVHPAWVNLMARGRSSVIRKFLDWQCEDPKVARVVLRNRCQVPAQRLPLSLNWVQDCATRLTTTPPVELLSAVRRGGSLRPGLSQ